MVNQSPSDLSSIIAQIIAIEWRGCTPEAVSGMDCTRSPTLNTADEKSSTGGGKAAAAVKIK